MEAIKKKMAALKIEKDNALDKMETAENQLRDANMRGEKANEETMILENKLKQIENELVNSQNELENTTKRLEDKEKTLTNVSFSSCVK